MTNKDKPSIAELQRVATHSGNPAEQSMLIRADVALALLEIAAAALAVQQARREYFTDQGVSEYFTDQGVTCRRVCQAHAVLDAALAKVQS